VASEEGNIPRQTLPDFARTLAVSGAQLGWLFGAGTSASGGIPTAGQLLDEFKAILYASRNNLSQAEVRMGDPLIAGRVHSFFDNAHGVPSLGDPDEYAAAFELTYADPAVRRQWLDQWISRGRPSYGHRAVAVLIASGLIRWIATTNFDDLVERGYEQLRARDTNLSRMTVAAIDSPDRAARAFREEDWPALIKLHGDIASERLKNTSDELNKQDETLRRSILDASRSYGLAVIGYSGRDTSVMETLRAALAEKGAFPRGLFWLTSDPSNAFSAVHDLLSAARDAGVDACFVESANFDESFGVIARHVTLPDALGNYLSEGQPAPRVRGVVLNLTEGGRFPALRLNALPVIELPKTAIHVHCKHQIDERPGILLREIGIPGFGVASGRDFYGYGLTNIWQQALARYEPESVEEIEMSIDPAAPNLTFVGLLNEAIARAVALDRPLRPVFRTKGHRLVVSPDASEETTQLFAPLVSAYEDASLTGTLEGERTWREGVRIRLDWRLDRVWLLFEPWTFVDPPPRVEGEEWKPRSHFVAPDAAAAWVKERWATRRNAAWATAIGAWADLLVPEETAIVSAPFIENSRLVAASFTLGQRTAYSLPGAKATGSAQ
jgi:NAD-dependent SIR2 family protein deacetylase